MSSVCHKVDLYMAVVGVWFVGGVGFRQGGIRGIPGECGPVVYAV